MADALGGAGAAACARGRAAYGPSTGRAPRRSRPRGPATADVGDGEQLARCSGSNVATPLADRVAELPARDREGHLSVVPVSRDDVAALDEDERLSVRAERDVVWEGLHVAQSRRGVLAVLEPELHSGEMDGGVHGEPARGREDVVDDGLRIHDLEGRPRRRVPLGERRCGGCRQQQTTGGQGGEDAGCRSSWGASWSMLGAREASGRPGGRPSGLTRGSTAGNTGPAHLPDHLRRRRAVRVQSLQGTGTHVWRPQAHSGPETSLITGAAR